MLYQLVLHQPQLIQLAHIRPVAPELASVQFDPTHSWPHRLAIFRQSSQSLHVRLGQGDFGYVHFGFLRLSGL
ncbi:hypothetical protein D3C84_1239560 [compost metagenome]